ncbi:MAG: threonine synthase [Candidatus Heimdallarchaeota archaeon]|nr:MAG: threonine synthase [Candidatus Heimdallarchaeota archaeon]
MKDQKEEYSNESYLESVICTSCNKHYSPTQKLGLCPACNKVLFAQYNLERAQESFSRNTSNRSYDIWRFLEIMPVVNPKFRYTLGEGWTPILNLRNAGEHSGLKNLHLKEEGYNPTGTFKSRGLCAAVSKGIELGIHDFVIPTAGNAGAALAAYAACTGTKAHVFMPDDTPSFLQSEVIALGGELTLIPGLITDAAAQVQIAIENQGWFDVSTLKEPYRVEGKKTMGLELLEQFNWQVPDVIVYPTGGGTGIVGMWKAFTELEELGIIGSERPRMVTVQSSTCAPIVRAFEKGRKTAEFWKNAKTFAPGLRVPAAIGDYLILNALYESKGTAVVVDDSEIILAIKELAKLEGIMQAPEGASTYAGVRKLVESGEIDSSELVILFGTGSGFIYPSLWKDIFLEQNNI